MVDFVSPIDTLAGLAGALEPQRTNMWTLEIFNQAHSNMKLALSKCDMPQETSELITIPYLNQEFYVAGRFKVGQIKVEFVDYANLGAAEEIRVWRQAVGNPFTGGVGVNLLYKREATLSLLGGVASVGQLPLDVTMRRSWRLLGMFPVEVSWGSGLDMSANEANRISVTFSIDRAVPLYPYLAK